MTRKKYSGKEQKLDKQALDVAGLCRYIGAGSTTPVNRNTRQFARDLPVYGGNTWNDAMQDSGFEIIGTCLKRIILCVIGIYFY